MILYSFTMVREGFSEILECLKNIQNPSMYLYRSRKPKFRTTGFIVKVPLPSDTHFKQSCMKYRLRSCSHLIITVVLLLRKKKYSLQWVLFGAWATEIPGSAPCLQGLAPGFWFELPTIVSLAFTGWNMDRQPLPLHNLGTVILSDCRSSGESRALEKDPWLLLQVPRAQSESLQQIPLFGLK